MTTPLLKRYEKRRPLGHFFALATIVLLVYLSLFSVDMQEGDPTTFDGSVWDFSSFTDPDRFAMGWQRVKDFVAGFGSPDLSTTDEFAGSDDARTRSEREEATTSFGFGGYIGRAIELTGQTLSSALLGTAIAIVFAYLLALGASRAVSVGEERGPKWLRWIPLRSPGAAICSMCRFILDVLRAVPDFAWAVLLVPLLGIGPMTGMLALAISVTGILGKIYSEIWDSVDPRRYESVRAVGAGRLRTFMYGIRPLSSRAMLSYTLMRAECAIRNAAVIGVVGGGGVGAEIKLRIDYGEYDRVATMVLFTLALTFGADMAANFIRRLLRHDPNHPRAVRHNSLRWQMGRKWISVASVVALVAWSVWYQSIEHKTVREPQFERLSQLFDAQGWRNMAFFERLLHPELEWQVEREGALVKSHFIGRVGQWDDAMKDAESVKNPDLFKAGLKGKRLVLGPVSREQAHDGPRAYIEKLTGEKLEATFASVVSTNSDKETMLMVARGEADIGAIEEASFGPARKDEELAPFMKRRAPVIDRAHSTDYYRATKVEPGALPVSLRSAMIPVGMAIIGTLMGVLAAMLLCYPHSVAFQLEAHRFTGESPSIVQRALRWLQAILARCVALTSRAIPEVMWAMFFVAFFGMGVVAGAFAIAIHSMGVLVRVFGETVDNIPYRRFEQAFGGSRVACFGYAAVPNSWRDWMTYSFFQLESNIRAGVVLGIIGSVGLGFVFSINFEHFHYEKAATNLIVIIMLTVVVDRVSRLLKLTRVAT